ncbi:MAG: hypothetical protein ACFE95_01740 [Candidatus Hodarchaeota archaeon]
MLKVPNEAVMRDLIQKLESEIDLDLRLSSYKSKSPELLDFASKEGIESNDAARALFVSDYIVTASEVPSGGTDEDRRRSVIRSFILGRKRCSSTEALMRIFYFAYKTAIKIRSQDLYMGGRGLSPRETALIRLKDSFLAPYLLIASETLGAGSCGWELGILSAALKRTYPDVEIQQFKEAPYYTDDRTLIEYSWRLFQDYMSVQTVKIDPKLVIPNINESQSILLLDASKPSLMSLWNLDTKISSLEAGVPPLTKSLNQKLDNMQLVLVRASIDDLGEHLFIVRDPFIDSKPILILKTPADELNLSKIITTLRMRGSEHNGWEKVISRGMVKISEKVPKIEKQPVIPSVQVDRPRKVGFFSRIKKALFGKKDEKIEQELPIQPKPIKKVRGRKVPPFIANNSYLAHGITVDAVSDLDIYELFDTIRETNYHVLGAFDSDFRNKKTYFSTKPNLHSKIRPFLQSLYKDISRFNEAAFSDNPKVLIEEVFFMTEDEQRYIISLNGNQERIVGTIATSQPDITEWQEREKEKEPLQRRSLHMRTKQFLNARRHTKFNEAVIRIYGPNFNVESAEEKKYDGLITVDS